VFGRLSKFSDCLHLACHSHSCSKSLQRVGRSSESFQQVVLDSYQGHLQTMILDDHEADEVCLACYLSALTVCFLPAIHTRVVSCWREWIASKSFQQVVLDSYQSAGADHDSG